MRQLTLEILTHPFKHFAVDSNTINSKDYLVVVDPYSKYPALACLSHKTAEKIGHTKLNYSVLWYSEDDISFESRL